MNYSQEMHVKEAYLALSLGTVGSSMPEFGTVLSNKILEVLVNVLGSIVGLVHLRIFAEERSVLIRGFSCHANYGCGFLVSKSYSFDC